MKSNIPNNYMTIRKKLRQFVNNKCTPKQKEEIMSWACDNRDRDETNESLIEIWNSDEKYEFDKNKVLEELETHLSQEIKKALKRKKRNLYKVIGIAASFFLLCSISFIIFKQGIITNNQSIAFIEKYVPYGEKLELVLPDSTILYANSGSTVKYPEFFNGKTREVYIEGEVFFIVQPNYNKPFIVKTGDINVQVLGTSFNITAYDKNIETTLITGKVEIYKHKKNKPREKIELTPGQKATYNSKKDSFSIKEVDTNYTTAWKDGYLIFDNQPLQEIVNRLERWYNVKINIEDKELFANSYTSNIRHETIVEVLNLIELTTPIIYEFEENKITIRKK